MELKDILQDSYFHTSKGMLLYGETLEQMSKLPDKSVDMILADLPYGMTAREAKGYIKKLQNFVVKYSTND